MSLKSSSSLIALLSSSPLKTDTAGLAPPVLPLPDPLGCLCCCCSFSLLMVKTCSRCRSSACATFSAMAGMAWISILWLRRGLIRTPPSSEERRPCWRERLLELSSISLTCGGGGSSLVTTLRYFCFLFGRLSVERWPVEFDLTNSVAIVKMSRVRERDSVGEREESVSERLCVWNTTYLLRKGSEGHATRLRSLLLLVKENDIVAKIWANSTQIQFSGGLLGEEISQIIIDAMNSLDSCLCK
jgi:hypothetical protein